MDVIFDPSNILSSIFLTEKTDPLSEFVVFDVMLAKLVRGTAKLVIHTIDPPHTKPNSPFISQIIVTNTTY